MFPQFRNVEGSLRLGEFVQIIPFMASLACSEAVRRIEPMKGPDPRNERVDRLGGLNLRIDLQTLPIILFNIVQY